MKLKEGFILNKVGGSYLAVAVGERADNFHAIIKLNESGAFLWRALEDGDKTKEELLALLLREYDVEESVAKRDITGFLTEMAKGGLLDV